MAFQLTADCYALWGVETTYGTAATAKKYRIGQIQGPISIRQREQGPIFARGIGTGRDASNQYLSPWGFEVNITWWMQDGAFCIPAWGIHKVSGTTDPYTHTVSKSDGAGSTPFSSTVVLADQIPSFTLEIGEKTGSTAKVYTITGCKMNSLTISGALGGVLTASASIVAQSVTMGTTAQTYSENTSDPAFLVTNGDVQMNNQSFPGLENFSFTLANNLIVFPQWNTYLIAEPQVGQRVHTWSTTHKGDQTTTFEGYFLGQAVGSGPLTNPTNATKTAYSVIMTLTRIASNRQVILTLSDSRIVDITDSINNSGTIVSQTLNGTSLSSTLVYYDGTATISAIA